MTLTRPQEAFKNCSSNPFLNVSIVITVTWPLNVSLQGVDEKRMNLKLKGESVALSDKGTGVSTAESAARKWRVQAIMCEQNTPNRCIFWHMLEPDLTESRCVPE